MSARWKFILVVGLSSLAAALLKELDRTDATWSAWSWLRVGLWWFGLQGVFALLLLFHGGETRFGQFLKGGSADSDSGDVDSP